MHPTISRRPGAAVAVFAGVVYLALRPPLYHFDGYIYRLKTLGPFATGVNPHHVLWHPIEVGLLKVFSLLGNTGTVPFQLFGIAVNCVTLCLFGSLLLRVSENRLLALAGTLLVAFSPTFWHFGFQNLPYPLTYLFVVLFLRAWTTRDGSPPSNAQLASAGASLAAAIFLQQAAVLLVLAGCISLLISLRERPSRRFLRALVWGAAVAAAVLLVYVAMAVITGSRSPADFVRWTTTYMRTEHAVKIRWAESLAKSVIGISRSAVRLSPLESYLGDNLAAGPTLMLYAGAGGLAVAALALSRGRWFPVPAIPLFRGDSLFAVSFLSVAAWSAFVFSWEPTGHFWNLNLFPVLLCAAILSRTWPPAFLKNAALLMIVVSAWNIYANHAHDRIARINFPDPLIASVRANVGDRDMFLVPGRDWFAGMDYGLLFEALDRSPLPNRGKALLNDFVMAGNGDSSWEESLDEEIRSVLRRHGRVFVADSVFWPSSYVDLLQAQDAYSEFVHEAYRDIDGPRLAEEVERFFSRYRRAETDFSIGDDTYWEILDAAPSR